MSAWPLWSSGLLLVLGVPLLAIVTQRFLRRRWSVLSEGDHNEVAGFLIAVVGVIYAVLLAFVVIVSWEQFSAAGDTVGQEASALRTIERTAAAFPADARARIHADVVAYAHAVIDDEWPAMSRGEPGSPTVGPTLDRLSVDLEALPADSPARTEIVGAEVERFHDLVTARSARLDYVPQGAPAVLWAALVVGAVVTIGFSMVFALRDRFLQTLMTGSIALLIGILLFVAVAIDHPFVGDVAVTPDPLQRVLADF
ncbi:DUF4239 domain-containing protein [Actinomycetospora sp. TBRC 11914]|uniref:bestrophin-like domain n=1 Tax=Actinomycetospora sp. TBRC 11914 TaxID=2729387 RepID=UPI00145DC1E7|nr:DUF4239 domain-containing protein [Actinomycetospora sp. TBRC 11914]NMO90416.1 DUF4239 domain-containing protein [Actinomycetospora sp. TBRC 11914]